jgi:hypothetical protein
MLWAKDRRGTRGGDAPAGRRYGGMEDLIMINLKVANAVDISVKAFPDYVPHLFCSDAPVERRPGALMCVQKT